MRIRFEKLLESSLKKNDSYSELWLEDLLTAKVQCLSLINSFKRWTRSFTNYGEKKYKLMEESITSIIHDEHFRRLADSS